MCASRVLIVIGSKRFSPNSVFSIKMDGFVKINSYCSFPQDGHSLAFFAFS